MNTTICESCGAQHNWTWQEAFDKFGFGDGDGLVMTDDVANVIRQAGYGVVTHKWGLHNVIITSITKGGKELLPEDAKIGYDDPRDYLPAKIIRLLDCELSDKEVF